jgi:hypothetical protein
MKKCSFLLFLLLISSGFLLLTGCYPGSSIVLSNDASLKELNELVKERSVLVTTTDSVYTGDNIIINRDSTVIENYSTIQNLIPLSVTFPTKELVKIQTRNHLVSTFNGFGYGLMIGVVGGVLIGSIGFAASGDPLLLLVTLSALGISGTIMGAVLVTGIGQLEDINITYRFENKSP